MSEKGHSMEWHLRQHGSAVVYMMLVGCKLWLVAPPTPHNLSLFQQWKLGGQGFTTFFPSQLERVSVTVAYTGQVCCCPRLALLQIRHMLPLKPLYTAHVVDVSSTCWLDSCGTQFHRFRHVLLESSCSPDASNVSGIDACRLGQRS